MNDCELCGRAPRDDTAVYLCVGCTVATRERLEALPGLYVALAAHLVPGARRDGRSASTGRAEAPMPVAELPLTMRGPGGMLAVLEDWRAALHADRGFNPPPLGGTYEQRITQAVKGLIDQLAFVAVSWPAAGAFAEEVRELVAAARSVVDPDGPRPRRLGWCIEQTPDGRCGAVVLLPPGSYVAQCAWCRSEYGSGRWLALAAAGEPDQEAGDAA